MARLFPASRLANRVAQLRKLVEARLAATTSEAEIERLQTVRC